MDAIILGLFALSIVMQIAYMFLLYTDRNPVLTFIIGPVTSVTWYTLAQTVLVENQTIGVPIAYLLYLFSTLNVIPLFGLVYSIMYPRE